MTKRHRKAVSTTVDEETYMLLKRKAEARGYRILSDYLRYLIEKDIGAEETDTEASGLQLVDDLKRIVEQRIDRIERLVADLLNPYTGKIDRILAQLSEIQEQLESILSGATPTAPAYSSAEVQEGPSRALKHQPLVSYRREQPYTPPRKSAMDRLKEEGVVFEKDLDWLRRPDLFFSKLEREGAIVVELSGGRVAIDPSFLDELKVKLREVNIPEAESVETLLRPNEARLFRLLVESGKAYYDSVEGGWYIDI